MERLFETIAVPVASGRDADVTCAAIGPYASSDTDGAIAHVIEKAGGGIDPTPVEQQQRRAQRVIDRGVDALSPTGATVTTTVTYHTDADQGISDAAADADADAVAFAPREDGRLAESLAGDAAFKLVHRTDRPVVIVPPPPGDG